jgi:hypothetical protein
MAENLVKKEKKQIPVAIVRPGLGECSSISQNRHLSTHELVLIRVYKYLT